MILCAIVVILPICFIVYKRLTTGQHKASVVVLGDIGRSPRMQYHSLSLARHNYLVNFIGYGGSRPHGDILAEKNIKISYMKEPPAIIQGLPKLVVYFLKVVWQSVMLLLTLMVHQKSAYIFLQNPPCIPTLAVCWFVSVLQGSCLVVDWHNYGYTILGLTLGERHLLCRFSKQYEKFFGKFSTFNVCVTNAMKEDLKENWGISARTMHDRPPLKFKSASLSEQHILFAKLSTQYEVFKSKPLTDKEDTTIFTQKNASNICTKLKSRPALLVSSTSWTEDEDFSILLKALKEYDLQKLSGHSNLPDLICAITGKGPQKEYYQKEIDRMSLQHVKIVTPWLEAEDYPTLLGSADIGVCLHKSSSGLDLPMKVVDMFGCGLPVCAISFKCLHELVKHNHNGLIFQSSQQLAEQLQDLLRNYPDSCETLSMYRENLAKFQKVKWDETWNENVWPIFKNS